MHKTKLVLATAALLAFLPVLQGCLPAVVTGTAVGVMAVHDRRSAGTQADDEALEWKVRGRLPEQYKEQSNVSVTVYNKRLLLTGEVPSAEAKAATEAAARTVDGLREVFNELGIGPLSKLGSRSNDSYITSKVKARLVDSNQLSANHVKVVTERGITFLLGIVNEREAKAAVTVARTTAGVLKVVNLMEIIDEAETRRIDDQLLGTRNSPPASEPAENR
ncbi:BON domain-containing protein [Azonexus sp.]|jgi:osmotically-inducible protein OsmY|uniref:BON domain-containing protein n=1 Tax=Azonexus sp. TaxID=1872668 RepID=UPI00282E26CD|nr:BON domain-containing protein [Azonexus sp.]MDR1994865.1 BON domain-containing protein [Azonexus sp.]